jgi:hypothetical protein
LVSRSKLLLAVSVLLLVSVIPGCINAQWSKGYINPDEGEFKMTEVNKVFIEKRFRTTVNDPTTVQYHNENISAIIEGTEWMKVHVEVTLDDIPIPMELPFEMPERYVQLIVTMPDGLVWLDVTFNTTTAENFDVLFPVQGDWIITMDAVGYGSDLVDYYDGFKVFVDAYEPVPL